MLYESRQESWLLEVSNLRRISLRISGKKCYFCDVIPATLLFQWLRLKGVFFPRVSNDNGLARTEKIHSFLLQKQIMVPMHLALRKQYIQYVKIQVFKVFSFLKKPSTMICN